MPDEQQEAILSQRRGKVAAGIKDPKKRREFIATQGKGKTSREDLETETSRERNRQALGSFKRGGRVKKTGIYQVHSGEKVVPAKSRLKVFHAAMPPRKSRVRIKSGKRR